MMFGRKITSVLVAAGVAGIGVTGSAGAAHADTLDRQQKNCGGALVTAKLERDSNEYEVDVEVYSNSRGERWTMVIKDSNGDVLHRVNRKTNREGEFDMWRSIPGTKNAVSVDVRGPSGESCTLRLQA